jgi:hypothetical protein
LIDNREGDVSDHEDDTGRDETPEPANLDGYRSRYRDKPPPPPHIRDGYRLDEETGILYGADGKQRCSAKARNSPGGVCHGWLVNGATRCRMHGGTTRQVKAKAVRKNVEATMQNLVSAMDMGPVHDPLTALKELAGEVMAWKDAMRLQVESLDELDHVSDYGESAKAVVQLFERAMDRAGDFLFKIARLNIDERLAAVTESQAKKIENAFFEALDEVGIPVLDIETRSKVSTAYARHLSVIPAS